MPALPPSTSWSPLWLEFRWAHSTNLADFLCEHAAVTRFEVCTFINDFGIVAFVFAVVETLLAQQAYRLDPPKGKKTSRMFGSLQSAYCPFMVCSLVRMQFTQSSISNPQLSHLQVFHCLIGAANIGKSYVGFILKSWVSLLGSMYVICVSQGHKILLFGCFAALDVFWILVDIYIYIFLIKAND
jgi:hypothetical protein